MRYLEILREFEEFLQSYPIEMEGFHPVFAKAFWEMLKNGGKRFRPALLFAVVCSQNFSLAKNAFLPALALECLHTYSLIHDDLPCMDDASLRRGYPTLHRSYDEVTATLVGDGLNTFSFYLLTKAHLDPSTRLRLIEMLSHYGGIGGMVIGQAMDCYFENQHLEIEKLYAIHLNKTAKLIATSLCMGGVIVNLPDGELRNLWDFGMDLGIFFQVRDDIIDRVENAQSVGKTTNNDYNKNSYVNLLGLSGAREEQRRLKALIVERLFAFPPLLQENLKVLLQKYFEEK
ncbi:geranyltranstransferase [Helicobacter mustelae]|uniref:polyprenyl synthetase family protein n=1 Tax=Helicobacter mustelae TaxID=217 RepID=UPI000DF90D2C|nr:polyprenyl synthetase family protein [Helicobacter mustelae]STP12868.1 geranyltranstransferase [Helicobacter mustelae]